MKNGGSFHCYVSSPEGNLEHLDTINSAVLSAVVNYAEMTTSSSMNLCTYPLVMTNIAMVQMAHRNRWFTWVYHS